MLRFVFADSLDFCQEVRDKPLYRYESISNFSSFNMLVVALPSLVVVAHDTLACPTVIQAVLQSVWPLRVGRGKLPDGQLDNRAIG